ncbi:Uncharacterised protein [uncultured archaeon]|nr:Uncharacterised protein [uncultured archaeon]
MFSSDHFRSMRTALLYQPGKESSPVRLGEGRMVVGRTLWDFVFEIFQMPGMMIYILALTILLELLFILLIISIHFGLIGVKFSFGGLGIELHGLSLLAAYCR